MTNIPKSIRPPGLLGPDAIKLANIKLLHEIGREKNLSADRIAYLEKVMNKESSNGILADTKGRSSAAGLFQFTNETWEDQVKKHPTELTMDGRNNSRQQIIAAIYFTDENEKALAAAIGRVPNHGDLYLAHFSGKGNSECGAIGALLISENDPNRPIKGDPSKKIRGILSAKEIEANSYKSDKDKGIRINRSDKAFLPIEDFAAGDLVNWAYAKMGIPPLRTTNSSSKYRMDEKGIPDAQGNWVMVAIAVAAMAVAAIVTGIGSFFSDDSPNPGNIPTRPRGNTRA